MQLFHFPRSLTAITRAALAFVMLALTLLGSARSAAAATTPIINRVGSGFEFHVKNSTAITWKVRAGTKAPVFDANANLSFPSGSNVVILSSNGGAQTSFDPFIGGLIPNTTYYYLLEAGSASTSGTLGTTLHRKATINFNSITVTNDSDSSGKGELTYNFKVDGVYRSALTFFRGTSSPDTFNPNWVVTVFDGRATIPVLVEVQDDDCSFSTCVMEPPDFRSGSNSDFDWATAGNSIAFINDSSNSISKTVPYAVESFVGFKGTALVSVSYS
jgi:hypothetical protein